MILRKEIFFALFIALVITMPMAAQWTPAEKKLDTLSVSDRLSLRTNGTDWLLLVPNVGIEYDLGKYNYNRLTAALNLRWKWGTGHTFVPKTQYNIFEVKGEVRSYWRTRQVTDEKGACPPHIHLWDKLMSLRRKQPRHPVTTFYRGVWLSYSTYSIYLEMLKKHGRQGSALMGGVLYGIQRPLYRYPSGRSIDLDLGVSVGVAMVNYKVYDQDKDNNRYKQRGKPTDGWKLIPFPVVAEIRAGLVYRLGKTPGYDKYNFRYDVEQAYRATIDEHNREENTRRENIRIATKVFNDAFDCYQQKLDSVLMAHPEWKLTDKQQQREKEKSIHKAEAEKKKAEAEKKKAEKEQQRKAKEKAKEEKAKAEEAKAEEAKAEEAKEEEAKEEKEAEAEEAKEEKEAEAKEAVDS